VNYKIFLTQPNTCQRAVLSRFSCLKDTRVTQNMMTMFNLTTSDLKSWLVMLLYCLLHLRQPYRQHRMKHLQQ